MNTLRAENAAKNRFGTFGTYVVQGFPKKTPVLKIENVPGIFGNDGEGKIMKIPILAIGRLLWETLYVLTRGQCFHSLFLVISLILGRIINRKT